MEQDFEFEAGYNASLDNHSDHTTETFSENSDDGDSSFATEKPLQVHLDKWLWAARFYKTLALSRKAIQNGKIYYDGQRSRSSVEIKVGGLLRIQHGNVDKLIVVTGLSTRRRSMKDAALLYQDISHHQETLRQVADSYKPQKSRSRYPFFSNTIQHRHYPPDAIPAERPYPREENTGWQKPKKLVRFLRKPAHRLTHNPHTVPEMELELESD